MMLSQCHLGMMNAFHLYVLCQIFYSAISFHWITIHITSGRGGVCGIIQLPFKLKSSAIRAAPDRGVLFELPYGSALVVDMSKRKAFSTKTARLF